MTTPKTLFFLLFFLPFLFLSGCASDSNDQENQTLADAAVMCIGVMPVKTGIDYENEPSFAGVKKLENGAEALDLILRDTLRQLHGERDYRFISRYSAERLSQSGGSSPEDELLEAAGRVNCPAMLEVVIEKYSDRVGGRFSAQEPASAAFSYRLYDVTRKKILCHGRYDETQQSLMENLYNLKKATNRGFVMITAEQLLEEGVKEKFDQCPYLSD
ncbi:MAG: hypothetical protein CSA20_00855 [Deltaproteobacteria bacterium]|nr:MAG: hypothetical protein CSA20_00855 [Deltaproteobacteria bacterium]